MQKNTQDNKLEATYTIQEIAKTYGVHVVSVYRWVQQGKLKKIKVGGMTRIKKSDLEDFINNSKND